MKTIGITTSIITDNSGVFANYERMYVNKDYLSSVEQAGAMPFLIPLTDNEEYVRKYISMVDAVILSGGHDVFPYNYGEEPRMKIGTVFPYRDKCDFLVIKIAIEMKKPILGICRGMQVLNVFLGGTLYQDLSEAGFTLKHSQNQKPTDRIQRITIEKENSMLYEALKEKEVFVNTFHHQAINKLGKDLEIIARASDGIIEAVENRKMNIYGVQFHPEMLYRDLDMLNLFKKFVEII